MSVRARAPLIFTSVVILSLNAVISVCNDEILSYWKWPPPPVVEDFSLFFRDKLLADEQMNPFFQQMGLGSKLNFQFFKTLLTPHCTVAGPLECMGTWGLVSSPNVLADMSKVWTSNPTPIRVWGQGEDDPSKKKLIPSISEVRA
jgi:hypothetical protein